MSHLTNVCLHSEQLSTLSGTMNIFKKYTSSEIDNDEHALVFVHNNEGKSFRVFTSIQNLLLSDNAQSIANFENANELVKFLSGNTHDGNQGIAIGANCLIRYTDLQDEAKVYISFSKVIEDRNGENDLDDFGIPDNQIFYYAEDGEAELIQLMNSVAGDFVVLKYDIQYRESLSNPSI